MRMRLIHCAASKADEDRLILYAASKAENDVAHPL
jgi:hypothetical protein